ncbi:MAG: type IX secretion system sortase PorU [Ignavibacteriales bacterium]|nr:type IX secretion system sortase PorU [Ignavibacteriales bacterium]
MKYKFFLVILFFVLNLTANAQDLRILSSDRTSIIIEYRPIYKDTITISTSGNSFIKLNLLGGYIENITKSGLPQIPVREINVGVPSELGNTIQILSADYSTLNGQYVPVPQLRKDSLSSVENYIVGDKYSNFSAPDIAAFGEYGLVRNLPVQSIKIHPVIFDVSSNVIKIYKKIVIKISFASSPSNRELIEDNTFQSVVLNWETAKNWGISDKKLFKTSASVLAAGDWFRFEAPDEGIYKIDRTFLQAIGIDVIAADFNPRTIKIYNNGGYPLPEDLSKSNNQGLIENAITVFGEEDGRFDTNDYILFYGRPQEFWEYSSSAKNIVRIKQPYSKKNYYWLTYGGTNGKRISNKLSTNAANAYQQTSTLAFNSLDKDIVNIGRSGRDYFGDLLDNSSKNKTYLTTLSGIVPSSIIKYNFRVANASTDAFTFSVEESGNQIYSAYVSGIYRYVFGIENIGAAVYGGQLSDERSNLKFSINTSSSSASLYIDYFEIAYQRQLKSVSDYLLLFSKDTTAAIGYTLSNFSNSSIQTYDVTDHANVKNISNAIISGGQFKFQSAEISGKVSRYLAVTSTAYRTPINGVKITNSNIRGNLAGSEMIVITAKDFKTQAERYAAYRSNQSPYKLSTQIFYVDEILNEFSCGSLDPTAIRDFLKFAYENWQLKPFYVLLLGDGDYDYLNIEKLNKNFVPVYETAESLYEISSYPTDDYYARISGNDKRNDIAIGRSNIQTAAEADVVVDKIIKYETGLEKGLWRNNITLVADDGPQEVGYDDGSLHTSQSENLANIRIPKYFDLDKIYLAAYPTVYTGLGRRKPEVNKAIINAINNGTLVINYVGHGNPGVWAHESVFERTASIPQLKNPNYFFLTAATCDFGKYDDPTEQSSTEILMNKKDAGAIAAFSAARVVYSDSNARINDSLYSCLFRAREIGNLPIRIGKAYLLAKQFLAQENDEKFHLFGDPALRLDEPLNPTSIDSVNSKSLKSVVQVNALGSVKIKGTVRNTNGTLTQYNGDAIISMYDSERSLYLKEMDYSVTMQGGLIFRGKTSVTNSEFQTEFVVPKDISYENKNGKIVAYIANNTTDGVGYSTNVIVGGTNPDAVNDGKGPEISIYFDDITYESSYLVNPDFTLIAKLSDRTGLNTTGTGIGHKLEAILNDDETNSIDLTNSFIGDLNSGGKSGLIKYKFTGMTPGDYKIKVKAWDVFNNFSSQEANFSVLSSDKGIVLRDVVNYPNPFSSNTTFTFQHNVASAINVKIKIYTIAGRLIKQIEQSNILDKFVRIDWDGRDADENQIANSTYLYKLIVESVDGKYKDNVLGKLAVIR